MPVNVTNTGLIAKAYFADARLNSLVDVTLPQGACSAATTVPGLCLTTVVPPESSSIRFLAQSSGPVNMDAAPGSGNPDIFAQVYGNNAVVSATASEMAFGVWGIYPAAVGPFGDAGAPTESVTVTTTAKTLAFDPAVSASSGDFWADQVNGTSTFNPLVLAPGASGTITLTIQPAATQVGRTVRGNVYVDTSNEADGYGIGDEAVSIPYAYTVTH